MTCELQYQTLLITELENANEMLLDKKEQLDKDKKMTAETNEDLERNLNAKEEANLRRLLNKLQRDKNPHIKELIAKVEEKKTNTEEFSAKLRDETEKHDGLKDALVEIMERLKVKTAEFEEIKEKVEK